MEELEKRMREEHGNLTYDEIMELLEEEQYSYDEDYRPLNFHDDDDDEDFEG